MHNHLKNLVKDIRFWLCLGFALLYIVNGLRMIDTLVYDYDGLLFHTDTAEVAEDITVFQTRAHGDTNVHPLFVMFVNPLALLLQIVCNAPVCIVIINTLLATLIVLCAWNFFRTIGLPVYQALLWTILTGCTANNLLFASIPERHILAAFTMTFMFFIAARYPAGFIKFIWAGILTIGATVTNFAQCGIIFLCSLFHDRKNTRRSFSEIITKTIQFGAATLVLAMLLSFIQKWIWPNTRLFFLPSGYIEETAFFFTPTTLAALKAKLIELGANMFVFNIVAPEPAITIKEKFCPLLFNLQSFQTYTPVGWIAVITWATIAGTALVLTIVKPGKWLWMQIGIVLCLIFNAALHMVYGDDFFLYTVNWTFPLIAFLACAIVSTSKALLSRLFFNIMLTLLVLSTATNNIRFERNLSNYFRNGNSQMWLKFQWDYWNQSKSIQKFLSQENIHTLYSGDRQKWLMSALNHEVNVVNVPSEQSPALKQSAELISEGYAFWYDIGDVASFIRNTMGSYSMKDFDEYSFYYNIMPPFDDLSSCAQFIKSVSASYMSDTASNAIDLNLDTAWVGANARGTEDWLEYQFSEKTLVSCVKLFSRTGKYPMQWRIEIRESETAPWQTATPEMSSPGYFWSGPRIFWNGRQTHLEARFIPTPIVGLRLVFPANDEGRKPIVSEARIYGPGEPHLAETTTLPLLMDELRKKNINILYSERWAANAVHTQTEGKIKTLLEPFIFKQVRARPQPNISQEPYPVYFSKDTAILALAENADATRFCLATREYQMLETTVGPWILFSFDQSKWNDSWSGYSGLYWSGVSCFLANQNGAAKEKAKELSDKAQREKTSREKQSMLERALTFYPDHQETLMSLLELKSSAGDTNGAATISARLSYLREPNLKTPVRFNSQIQLLGITVENKVVNPGDDLTIRYYWRFNPTKSEPNRWSTFIHFKKDSKIIFQGDHDIGAEYSSEELLCQTKDEIMMETTTTRVPPDAPAGSYSIFMGCYDKQTAKRLPPEADGNVIIKHKGVLLPEVCNITVQQAEK